MQNTNLTENIQFKKIIDKQNPNILININDELKNNLFISNIDKKIIDQQDQKKSNKKEKEKEKVKEKNNKEEINEKQINSVVNTKKIDYRFYSYYPLDDILPFPEYDKNDNYFWLATYDKLIKKKKLFKIFSFYNVASRSSIVIGNEGIYNDFSKIKEKKMIIKNYELYFIEKHNKPFIRKCEEKYIYAKLYLLTLKQINMIFSYLNRIEYKEYINNLNYFEEKDSYKKICELGNNDEYDLNYSSIICLGSYMNRNIYGFSRIENKDEIYNNYSIGVDNYPNSKKIAKLIKLLMINFPENTKEHFISYIFNDSHNNGLNKKMLTDKKNEINHLLISKKKSLYKANSKNNSFMQSIISGIPEFSFSPYFSSNTYNNNFNTNTNINKNKINTNNIGTISYNASYFDFTSDYIYLLKLKEETKSKAFDSMKNISHQQLRNKTINNNTSNENSKINIKDKKISNFSFENDSKNSQNYIKINISRGNNDNKDKNDTNKIKKQNLNNNNNNNNIKNEQLPMKKVMQVQLKKKHNILNSKKGGIANSNNISDITQSILEDNKENLNSISNIKEINKSHNYAKISDLSKLKVNKYFNKKTSKMLFDINNFNSNKNNRTSLINKTFLKGEDIFMKTNTSNRKNHSGIYRTQNETRSSYYKIYRDNPIFKMSKKLGISSKLNKTNITNIK